ncbi:GNAT family N-acetyltransferase [Enterovirga rhinocerotis]|uniref:CelD/BcsL family acetyltransferase involved in cellulose biosynthesis n=1 Tax=Enterovirga rhinocerotis TaxID=1339210 RepID=A0A4R7C890_9HYPH|nr:GNAT family N-acetyltransferase [Enterovirga rhinocerotis]TDR94658.1 CelD/BcsL family acetyltransferase involved in cellulose biosynthesis [Enterovirga rhinocerotis]
MTTGPADPIEARLLGPDALAELADAWDDLAGRALDPNPFLSPAFGRARLHHLPDGRAARLLVAWSRSGGRRRLVGLSVLVPPRGRHFTPCRILRSAQLYAPVSTPLVAPEAPVETISAMLGALRRAGFGGLALPFLARHGAVAAALREAAEREALPLVVLDEHERAFLRSPLGGAEYLRTAIDRRRRREADRQRRRLAELGTLTFSVASEPDDVTAALERFLALEAAGWKGQGGTAIAHADGAAPFFREAAFEGARTGAFRVATLALDDRPVAAGLLAIAGRHAAYIKTAYDEEMARFSPGLLLTLDLTAHLLDDPAIDEADSLAVAGHPMIDRIWTGRLPIESVLVGTRPGRPLAFAVAKAVERNRERAIDLAKALRRRQA